MPDQEAQPKNVYSIEELLARGIIPNQTDLHAPQASLDAVDKAAQGQSVNGAQTSQEPTKLFPDVEIGPQHANMIEQIALKLNKQGDTRRLDVGCALINTFNYAIQVQAARMSWQTSDYRAFIIALSAIDSIGIEAISKAEDALSELKARAAK